MNYRVIWTSKFKKEYKLAIKRGLDIERIDNVIRTLARGQQLSEEYNDHYYRVIGKAIVNVIYNPIGF